MQCYPIPSQKVISSERRENWIFKPHPKKSQVEAFSYSYVIEDGRLPHIAEHHPVRVASPSSVQSQNATSQIPIPRKKSLRRRENAERHSAPLSTTSPPISPSKSDMVKRALSLSSMRSSRGSFRSNHSRSNSIRSNSPGLHLPAIPPMPTVVYDLNISPFMAGEMGQDRLPAIAPATLTLTLPTPSPSPEPSQRSFESRPSSVLSSSGASYTTIDDQLDLLNLQRAAMGRLTPNPALSFQVRRDKAFATLGITSPNSYPFTPPFTPLASTVPSKAPSVHDQSGQPKRKNSVQFSATTTARSSVAENPRSSNEQPRVSTELPRPILKRKTSKFIEHIDNKPEPVPEPKRDSMEITTVDSVRFELQHPTPIKLQTPTFRPGVGIRRSESMITPTPGARWSGVVCTAEARSVVAAGSAKLVSF